MKPRIFVGSSTERLDLARAVQANLNGDATIQVWDQGVFGLSEYNLDSLLQALDESDFGVFIFSPDDSANVRGEHKFTVRDNVLFEAGLFAGRLGRERTFFVAPSPNTGENNIASDLNGLKFGFFDPSDLKQNTKQAVIAPICEEIRRPLTRLSRKPSFVPSRVVLSAANVLSRVAQVVDLDRTAQDVPSACHLIHQFAQDSLRALWPNDDHRVVVSLKVVDLGSFVDGCPTQLRCYYPVGVLQDPELFGYGTNEEPLLPINGTVAGDAFIQKRAQFVPDVKEAKNRWADPKIFERISSVLGSIVAWPIMLEGQVVAVVKVHAQTRNLLGVHNEQFMAVMELIVAQFQATLKISKLLDPAIVERNSPGKTKTPSGKKRKVANRS